MSNFDNATHSEKLDQVILRLLDTVIGMEDNSEEYKGAIDNLVKLTKIKNDSLKLESDSLSEDRKFGLDASKAASEEEKLRIETDRVEFEKEKFRFEKEKFLTWRPSPDAIVAGAASILGIVAILHYEKVGVVTSTALRFVGRLK